VTQQELSASFRCCYVLVLYTAWFDFGSFPSAGLLAWPGRLGRLLAAPTQTALFLGETTTTTSAVEPKRAALACLSDDGKARKAMVVILSGGGGGGCVVPSHGSSIPPLSYLFDLCLFTLNEMDGLTGVRRPWTE
jgi:hypothetical protein